jgi:hypothetical protein
VAYWYYIPNGTTSITSASSTTSTVWDYWCDSTSTATTSNGVWVEWCSGTYATNDPQTFRRQYLNEWQAPPPETEEQRAVRIARDAEAEARYKAEQEKRKAAEAKAEKLLLENLSLRQRDEFRKHGHFIVHGKTRRYRIRRGWSGNIDVVDKEGRIDHRLCAHPIEHVPDHDNMLAQKLWLESDEDAFVRIANRHSHIGDRNPILPALH